MRDYMRVERKINEKVVVPAKDVAWEKVSYSTLLLRETFLRVLSFTLITNLGQNETENALGALLGGTT